MSDLTIKGLLEAREEHYKAIDSIDAELKESGVKFCTDSRLQLYRGIEKVAKVSESDLAESHFNGDYPYQYKTGECYQIEKESLLDVDLQ